MVLTRHKNDSLTIQHKGETMRLVVTDIQGGTFGGKTRVRLGFDGPHSFEILRSELDEAEQKGESC